MPLIIWPSLISTLLQIDSPSRGSSEYSGSHYAHGSLEQYFARSLGLAQLALAALLLVLSGVLAPSSGTTAATDSETSVTSTASGAVLVSALHHAAVASYAYSRYHTTGGQMGYLVGSVAAGGLAVSGLWVLLFAGDKQRTSRRTGADKDTSGWPFRNAEADKRKGKKRL